jgi:5-formyltetrahydrofolate cyclo-ligase
MDTGKEDLQKQKLELRAKIRAALEKISQAVRAVESMDLCERLKIQMRSARAILFFAPLPDELDVWPLLEESLASGKIIALPFFDVEGKKYGTRRLKNLATEIIIGKFGVREPIQSCAEIPLQLFDLILVPGMAFDLHGNRLGRGKGFYDRLLANANALKCGVGHDFQLLEKIPAEPHDGKVDYILTPKRCVKAEKKLSSDGYSC